MERVTRDCVMDRAILTTHNLFVSEGGLVLSWSLCPSFPGLGSLTIPRGRQDGSAVCPVVFRADLRKWFDSHGLKAVDQSGPGTPRRRRVVVSRRAGGIARGGGSQRL